MDSFDRQSHPAALNRMKAYGMGDQIAVVFRGTYECASPGQPGFGGDGNLGFHCRLMVSAVEQVNGRL